MWILVYFGSIASVGIFNVFVLKRRGEINREKRADVVLNFVPRRRSWV